MKGRGGVAEEKIGAADPDFTAGVEGEFDAGIGATDGGFGGGLVGEGDEAGFGGTVELSEFRGRGEGGEGGAERGVKLGTSDEDQAEVAAFAPPVVPEL